MKYLSGFIGIRLYGNSIGTLPAFTESRDTVVSSVLKLLTKLCDKKEAGKREVY